MSVYIIRKIEMLYKLIKNTIEAIWSNTTISTFTNIGNQKRISFTVDGKEATIDVYQKKDGTTTFSSVGKNVDLTNQLIVELEKKGYPATSEQKSFTMTVGSTWIQKSIDYMIHLVTENNYGTYNSKKNNGNTVHTYISLIGDKLTLTECGNGKLVIQGKPLYLYNEFISFVSCSPNVNIEEIVAVTKAFVTNKVTDASSARVKIASLMPNTYNSKLIDDAIWKVLSPSMALIDSEAVMEDYSCIMFPALRALEGYLKFIFSEIGEVIDSHHPIGSIFNVDPNDPNKFLMTKSTAITNANLVGSQYKSALEELYTYFNKHRHVSFHMSQIFIDTKIISDKQEAIDTVYEVCDLIERTFVATHT